jgi:hypothetical protein
MRGIIAIAFVCAACSGESAGVEQAKKQAEAELEAKIKSGAPAKKISPPVSGEAKLPCDQVIDVAAFQTALAEKEPLVLKDVTQKKGEIAASCDLIRGGKPITAAEEAALLKKEGRTGVVSGDIICNIQLLCYTIEDSERFKKRCVDRKERNDESMGTFACVQVVATGRHDVDLYRFFDEDTKCVFEIRGGPRNVDNDVIRTCAKTARDTIGLPQIEVKSAPAAGSGS